MNNFLPYIKPNALNFNYCRLTKNWESPMSFLIPFCYSLNFMIILSNFINMAETCPIINFNFSAPTKKYILYFSYGWNKCLIRWCYRYKSSSDTNNYRLFIYWPSWLNIKTTSLIQAKCLHYLFFYLFNHHHSITYSNQSL